jgi:hypothetical protein
MNRKLACYFSVLFFGLSIKTFALDYARGSMVPWSKEGVFDFCPDSKAFDYRNAYWMAAMAYYSYWSPKDLEPIIRAPFGQPVTVEIQDPAKDSPKTIDALGIGWNGHVDFFTSANNVPHSPKKYGNNHSSYFVAPLPIEACVKKEKQWCFSTPHTSRRSQLEIRECGEKSELAIVDRERLRNIHELALGLDADGKDLSQILSDQKRIEHYSKAYEQKKNVDLGLDFLDPHFEERCEIYLTREDFVPDVQAIWMESSELVIIAFRGTEQDNIVDWTTDFATSFQLNHKYLPFWKRHVHKGYEQSLEIMSNWIQKEVNQLFKRYPHASRIPIFMTGHSMGGALATLVMTSLLERNQKTSADTQLNLKAIYTFGAPRIGNLNFAQYFVKLNESPKVGVYRLVNKKDIVTKAPCLDYSHFGTNIQFLSPDPSLSPVSNLDVTVNPSDDYNYCAYGASILDSLMNLKKYAKDHYLEAYYQLLKFTRSNLNRSLLSEKINFNKDIDWNRRRLNPYEYPANCNKVIFQNQNLPEYLKYNYEQLPFEIEN